MIVYLILAAWVVFLVVMALALCRSAARGDRQADGWRNEHR